MALYRLSDLHDDLVAPALVAAFDGWVDAAGAASQAAEHLSSDGDVIATFDGDKLFDYRSRRPVLDVVDGTLRELTWPAITVRRVRRGGRDVLALTGAEPDFRWRELAQAVLELCLRLGVVEWVSLGAVPAAVPHTRPVPVFATASKDGLLRDEDAVQGPDGLLRVPSACLSVVELEVSGSGIPAVGFYAQIPPYVGGGYAAGAVALLEHLGKHLGTELAVSDLVEQAVGQRERFDLAVSNDEDVRETVERLERLVGDAGGAPAPTSGDDLAAEIERFLRGQDGDEQGRFPGSS